MKRTATIVAVVLALALLTASAAMAGNGNGVEKLDIEQGFKGPVVGKAELIRSASGLKATAHVSGLEPGGVYTFWWVIPSDTHPVRSFAALGGSKIVGQNGKATVRMRADVGDSSIDGFFNHTEPLDVFPLDASFVDLTSDLLDDTIRIEVAYHGNVDSGAYTPQWELDFWTGEAGVCPVAADLEKRPPKMASTGQPHCPTFYAAESAATS